MLLAGPCTALLHPEFIELLAFGSDSAKPARSCPTQQWSRISLDDINTCSHNYSTPS